jgi:hypothetical protein
LLRSLDEPFLASIGEKVLQTVKLCGFLAAHHYRLVSPGPEFFTPAAQFSSLAGNVRVHEAHELGQLLRAICSEEEMVMVGQEDKGMHLNMIESLCSSEDADDDVPKLVCGSHEKTTLNRAAGNLDQRAGGDEPKPSRHLIYSRREMATKPSL